MQQREQLVLGRLLRRGETNEVWLARRARDRQPLALKRPRRPTASAVEQLHREAQRFEELAHPRVVTSLGLVAGSSPGLVLEAADAGSLRDVVARSGALSPSEVAAVVLAAAEALASLHARGWVHGDVSPGNLLYDRVRGPMLADLGSAARLGSPLEAPACTAPFAAPELSPGRAADPRSDIYALGSTALWLLAGRPQRASHERARRGPFLGILLRAVQADPAARPPTVAQLRAEMAHAGVIGDLDSLAHHVATRRRPPLPHVPPLLTKRFSP